MSRIVYWPTELEQDVMLLRSLRKLNEIGERACRIRHRNRLPFRDADRFISPWNGLQAAGGRRVRKGILGRQRCHTGRVPNYEDRRDADGAEKRNDRLGH